MQEDEWRQILKGTHVVLQDVGKSLGSLHINSFTSQRAHSNLLSNPDVYSLCLRILFFLKMDLDLGI